MKYTILLIMTFLGLFISCQTTENKATENNENKKMTDEIEGEKIKLLIDKVAFDPDKPMNIFDNNKTLICYYDRVVNKSGNINGAKILDLDNKVKYTIMPVVDINKYELYIQDDQNQRGKIIIKPESAFVTIVYNIETDFFSKPYIFSIDFINAMFAVIMETRVRYNNETVMFQSFDVSIAGVNVSEVELSKKYFEENKIDAATWCVIFQLINEINMDLSRRTTIIHNN